MDGGRDKRYWKRADGLRKVGQKYLYNEHMEEGRDKEIAKGLRGFKSGVYRIQTYSVNGVNRPCNRIVTHPQQIMRILCPQSESVWQIEFKYIYILHSLILKPPPQSY